ncbi:SusC/RagA family TonB-linked outer membrane protein [Flavilitoribacter nigricans]|uniref:SusC/RagA family TonB-linked outer membrane protein n=1 Tax=Flavilitoribacter nigricans (strain ATCC 23147 / DSM 23189 / NBRC 102662 / NCIMB 1420 / SS-2) TaxID=1122177 RepID=A0A2D0NGS6_FLAN2|nr:SusC/RagA family TonB-linked outer membrane protein [Flavilitoribacter nigricans]PHN07695.1 SusC/RagA family TonB-linked outer membrane protein [Flavilitoribacter nigricans DSM 23189 = NBRC 102662]
MNKMKHLLLAMILLLAGVGSPALSAHTADHSVTMEQSILLTEVLDQLSEEYKVFFSYDADLLRGIEVEVDLSRYRTLEQAIAGLLEQSGLKYDMIGPKYCVIYKDNRQGNRNKRKLERKIRQIEALENRGNLSLQRTTGSDDGKMPIRSISRGLSQLAVVFTVTGTVANDAGEPLTGVNILVKGSGKGTITDIDGKFTLELDNGDETLVLSYIGHETLEVPVRNRSEITITMREDIAALDEVVVIGYGTAKKSDVTGAVSSIKSEEITKVSSVRVDDALRGKVAGLQIIPTSSAPGAASTIRIRGSNSISANNEPLYVIDGFIGGGNLNDINLNDIESVEVLKDASATALYGSRGANGVILITTKRGKAGQSRMSYDVYTGYQAPIRLFEMLNASEYASWTNEVKGSNIYPNPDALGEGTDWQEEVYRNDAPITSHTLSVSGGSAKTRYFLSGNYFDQDGIFIESNLKRYQFRVNADHDVNDRLRLGNSVTISRTIDNPRSTNIINTAGWDPTLPVRDEDGNFTFQTVSSEFSADNPVANAVLNVNQRTRNRLLGNIFGEFEPIDGLTYRLSLGANLNNFRNESYAPSTLYSQRGNQGTATISNGENLDLLTEHTLSYAKDFGDHSLNTLIGYTRQRIFNTNSNVQTRGYVTDAFTFNNLGAGVERSAAGSGSSEIGFESFLFRANYSWKSKILLTLSARSDASSVFAANNKRALFPSGAIAWRLIEEDFIQGMGIFDDLKLRVSYGRLGNPGLGFGASLTRLSNSGNNYILGTNQDVVSGIAANSLGNDNLKWETTDQFDIGIDAGFFDNRLQVTLDYYSKLTNDLLINVQVPWLTSFSTSLSNFGQVSNKGLELAISTININRNDFRWETTFNIATNKNEVVDIFNEEGFIYTNSIGGVEAVASGILQEGEPIGTFYGMVRDGIWNSEQEIEDSGLTGFSVFAGGKRFVDLNGDGVISASEDRQIIGDANPDFFGGMGNTLSFKGFDLSFFLSFTVGNDVFNETDSRVGVALDNNTFKRYADRWTPTNMDSDVPSAEGAARTLITSDTGVIEDGSFVRLRNISLGYNFPVQSLNWIRSARLYANAVNLVTFDSYSGYDPEINRGFDNLRRGYDQAQYPTTKIFTLGLQVGF